MKLKKLSLLISLIGCMMFVNCNQIFAGSHKYLRVKAAKEKRSAVRLPIKTITAIKNENDLYFCPCCGHHYPYENIKCMNPNCPADCSSAIKNQLVPKGVSVNEAKKSFPICSKCHNHDVLMSFSYKNPRVVYCYNCDKEVSSNYLKFNKKPKTCKQKNSKLTLLNIACYLRENSISSKNKTKAWIDTVRTEFIKKAMYPHPLTFIDLKPYD